jgi:hypothetical protein
MSTEWKKELDVPAELNSGRTYVPLRFLAETLGLDVEWDSESGVIDIDEETMDEDPTEETPERKNLLMTLPLTQAVPDFTNIIRALPKGSALFRLKCQSLRQALCDLHHDGALHALAKKFAAVFIDALMSPVA